MKYFARLYGQKDKTSYLDIEVNDAFRIPGIGEKTIFHDGGTVWHARVFDISNEIQMPSELHYNDIVNQSSKPKEITGANHSGIIVHARLEEMIDFLS